MGPPKGAPLPEGSCPRASPEVTHSSGAESLDTSRHASSKHGAQHEKYHNFETKRRKAGAQQAAKVQEKATQLVQQLAAPDGSRGPYEHHGTLAKAEHRQDSYNQSIETKPWASSTEQACHNPTAGLPMQQTLLQILPSMFSKQVQTLHSIVYLCSHLSLLLNQLLRKVLSLRPTLSRLP